MKSFERLFEEDVAEFVEMKQRRFHTFKKLSTKIQMVAEYLSKHSINNVIVGVSGGIDSAVVFALLTQVKEQYLPALKIRGFCITFDEVYGHVFNASYIDLMRDTFCRNDDITITTIDGTATLKGLIGDLWLSNDKQLLAQASYALRYQMFFTMAQVHGGITIGTTNRDEFEYVGWFGKNSDMVVDLQIITDWYKLEVVEAAKALGVPPKIINRVPTGDLVDGTSDEANFGCSYNELAYFKQAQDFFPDAFLKCKYEKVIALHQKNAHKYQGQTFNPVFVK